MIYFQKSWAYFSVISCLVATSCQSSGDQQTLDLQGELNSLSVDTSSSAFQELVDQYSRAIPAPAEFTSFIYDAGIPYRKEILCMPSQQSKHLTQFKKALNAGVYGADLCYLSLYKKNREMPAYFEAIKNLLSDLQVDRVIALDKYKPLMEHPNDSILNMLSIDFERVNTFFRETNKSHLSWLVALGGWVESLHFSTSFKNPDNSTSQKMREKLAEQKIVLEDFIHMMQAFEKDPGFDELKPHLLSLKASFDKVEINYETADSSQTNEIDGVLVVEDASSSSFIVNNALMLEIQDQVEKLRTYIIQ